MTSRSVGYVYSVVGDSNMYPKYPFSVVWTPIPLLTWLFPMIGHIGICKSNGVIRDFAASYYVSEDSMAFGEPTKYWRLSPTYAKNGENGWDEAVAQASEVYEKRVHTLLWDNCHCHVAMALNLMEYKGRTNWNSFKLGYYMFKDGEYVSATAWLKTWGPFCTIAAMCTLCAIFL